MIIINKMRIPVTYLCHALLAGAAGDGDIAHIEVEPCEAEDGDGGSEWVDHELRHMPKRADCYARSQAKLKKNETSSSSRSCVT